MRCKHIMLSATMFAAAALAAPAIAAPAGSTSDPATQTQPSDQQTQPSDQQMQPGETGTGNTGTSNTGMQNSSGMETSTQAVPLTSVSDSKTKIMSAPVQDSSGATVGTVQQVSTGSNGRASTVLVTLTTASGQTKIVKIKASRLRYDSGSNMLKADLTESEIEKLPTATTTTNP